MRLSRGFDSPITFDGDVLRRSFDSRWKAESQGFPTVEESASEDITIKSYGQIESGPEFWKFDEMCKNSTQIVLISTNGIEFEHIS